MSEASYLQHGPKDEKTKLEVPLGEFVIAQLTKFGDRVAQVLEIEGLQLSITFAEILRCSRGVVRVLGEHGLEAGDAVMIACGNTLDFAPVLIGILTIGACCCPVIPDYEMDDFHHLLKVCEPRLVFCDAKSLASMRAAADLYQPRPPVVIPLSELTRRFSDPENDVEIKATPLADPANQVALVMTSSGTTGRPKGVEITQGTLYNTAVRHGGATTVVTINPFAAFWATGVSFNFVCAATGMKAVLLPTFTPQLFCEAVQRYKVSLACLGVQYMMALVRYPDIGDYDLSSLKVVGCGGTKATLEQLEAAEKALGTRVTPTYGMTEAFRMMKPVWDRTDKPGSVGTPDTNFIVKVVDIETRRHLGANCQGELCFTGPSVLKGYRGNAEATKELFDEEGFVKSGDIGYYDDDGYFYIVDRIKDHVKYKMTQQPCVDIESVILEHPDVLEAAVIGVPHEEDTEHSAAYVVLRPGAKVTAHDLVNLVKNKLSAMKWLHGGVFFIDKLPRTYSGKIKKHVLRHQHSVEP